MRGKIVTWKDDKGFGFIRPTKGGQDVFLHITDLLHKGFQPQVGDIVDFSLTSDDTGKPRAANATIPGVRKFYRVAPYSFTLIIPAVFIGALVGLGVHRYVLLAYLGTSVVSFLAYYTDKLRARSNEQRIPEIQLHLFDLFGGWPGALLAQQTLRHKTRKQPFQAVFWAIVAAHFAIWTYLWKEGLTPEDLIGRFPT